MAIKPALQAKLGTALALTPQLQQAIRLLQLSQPELLLALREATESNPLLEFDEPDAHAGEAAESAEPARDDAAPGDADDDAEHATDAGPEHDEFPADDLPRSAGTHDSPLDDISPAEGLKAHLLWQLRMALRTPRDLRIAEVLVDALDEDGYLREPLDALAASLPGLDADDFSAVLHLLQQCDPVGCGARDLGECLRLQLATLDPAPPGLALARRLVDGHLDALARQSPERLAAALQVEPAELASASALLRRLDPRPGARHAEARPEYVQPDAVAARVGGRWTVRMSRTPGLALNRHYEALIGHCRREDDAYLRGHLQEARWLIRALAHRGETLQRVAQAIVEAQSGFLDHGLEAMRPLTLRDIALPLGLHESTVSRATTRKYLRTPRGTFEFKFFFGAGLGDAGDASSATAVQERLRRIIAAEAPERPLSDQALADRLQAEGVRVARRTVAKYREMLGLPPAAERGRH